VGERQSSRVSERPVMVLVGGGYAMHMTGGRVRNKYGRAYPAWRKATKCAWGSRTYARRHYGTD
jgi:hypothetical protein